MDKEEALIDFLKSLRIVLNNASAYSINHPYFVKSVEDFKLKVDTLFAYLSPIKINVACDSLFIDEKRWQKQTLYIELANMFHLRKLRSVELREGVRVEELVVFLSSLALPAREILKLGGVQKILKKQETPHIFIEELDYSELLREGGEEVKDIWAHLVQEAIQKEDALRINEFAENFKENIKNFKLKDFLENAQLRESLYDFLYYLRANHKEKFCECARAIFNQLLKHKEALYDEKLDKIKSLFIDLDDNDYACMFWDGLLEDDSFDTLNLNLFSQLVGEEREKAIVSSLLTRAPDRGSLKNNPKAVKKIQELLSVSADQAVSEVYRNILSSLFKDITFEKGISFDRDLLNANYRFILLNILVQERHRKRVNLILGSLLKVWDEAAREQDSRFIKDLLEILRQLKSEKLPISDYSDELNKRIAGFLEGIIWERAVSPDLIALAEGLEKSAYTADFYLNKIFNEEKITPCGLRLFLRFFPEHLASFYKDLQEKNTDMEFAQNIIEALKTIDEQSSLEVLKNIYSFVNEVIKMEVLRAMQRLSRVDEEFIYSILKGAGVPLKKEAMSVLLRDPKTRKNGIELFASVSSPFGTRNKIILGNLTVIEELELKDASYYLTQLSRKPFFWNSGVRNRALEILRRWH